MNNVKCCFCCKEMKERIEWNTPESLCNELHSVCCTDCDNTYVIPCRRVLWHPLTSKDIYDKLLTHFKSLTLQELKALLPQNSYLDPQTYKTFIENLKRGGVDI